MVLVPRGIRMPAGTMVESESLYEADPMARPYVLKPVNEGSSVGVAIVTEGGNYGDPIGRDSEGPWRHFERLLAEPFIRGRELTVAVLGDEALAVTELQPKSGFYDYDAKYTEGMTQHICPAEIPEEIAAAAMTMAIEGAPGARLPRLLARRFPLGRRAGRGRPLSARDQHPARNDSAQPGARAGPLSRHELCRAGPEDRGGSVMSKAIARGSQARGKAEGSGARQGASAAARRAAGAGASRRGAPAELVDLPRDDDRARRRPALGASDPADGRRHAGRERRRDGLRDEAGRDQGRRPYPPDRRLQHRLRPAFHGDAAGRPRGDPAAAAPVRLGARRPGLAAAARHARRRHRRAAARGHLAAQPAARPDRHGRGGAGGGPARRDARSAAADRPRRQPPRRRAGAPHPGGAATSSRRWPARAGSAAAAGTCASSRARCSPFRKARRRRARRSPSSRAWTSRCSCSARAMSGSTCAIPSGC